MSTLFIVSIVIAVACLAGVQILLRVDFGKARFSEAAARLGGGRALGHVPRDLKLKREGFEVDLHGVKVMAGVCHEHLHERTEKRWSEAIALLKGAYRARKVMVVSEMRLMSMLDKFTGGQDVQVGHKAFDDRFLIKSNDEPWMRTWLNAQIIELHLKYPHLRFTLEDNIARIYNEESSPNVEESAAMIELCALYASAIERSVPLLAAAPHKPGGGPVF